MANGQDVEAETRKLDGQLERLRSVFILGDMGEPEYRQERARLQARRESLRPAELPDLEKAGQLLANFGAIWGAATEEERRAILRTLLQGVYLDAERGLVAIEPRAAFCELLEAGAAGFEPAVSSLTGRYARPLHHAPPERSHNSIETGISQTTAACSVLSPSECRCEPPAGAAPAVRNSPPRDRRCSSSARSAGIGIRRASPAAPCPTQRHPRPVGSHPPWG